MNVMESEGDVSATWQDDGGGGSVTYSKSDADAFDAGAAYLSANNAWGTYGFAPSFGYAQGSYYFEGGKDPDVLHLNPPIVVVGKIINDQWQTSQYNGHDLIFYPGQYTEDKSGIITIQWGGDPMEGQHWYNWDGPLFRTIVPDFANIGVGFSSIWGFGPSESIEFQWVLHGPQASWKPVLTTTTSAGVGFSVDATVNIGSANYSGNASDITRSMLITNTPQGDYPTIWGSAGAVFGPKIGVTGSLSYPNSDGYILGRQVNLGVGLPIGPIPANAAAGISNTFMLHDWGH